MRKLADIVRELMPARQVQITLSLEDEDVIAMDQPLHTIPNSKVLQGTLARSFAERMEAPLSDQCGDNDCIVIAKSTTSVSSIKARTPSGLKLMEAYVSGLVIMHETTASRCLKAIYNPIGLMTMTEEIIDPNSVKSLTKPMNTYVTQKRPDEIDMRWRTIDQMILEALRA